MHINEIGFQIELGGYKPDQMIVISGGQTGADQAGLRAAKMNGIKTGGWSTLGWRTQDGPQEEMLRGFGLVECDKAEYQIRTGLNVRDADITLRLAGDFGSSGEKCTYNWIKTHKKPYVDLNVPADLTHENAEKLTDYLKANLYHVINIAGNAESTCPGIGKQVEEFLDMVFTLLWLNDDLD